jgi:vesicle coat complex subunit
MKLKKLIYIFLTSNAQNNSSQSLLCVNALTMDSNDADSAIIRANSIRTMGSVATPNIAEHFTGPVLKGIVDPDPFVRKCAATCVAKLFKVKPDVVIDSQLLTSLRKALTDGNQAVVAAASAALISITNQLSTLEIQQILQCENEQTIFNAQEVQTLMTVLSQSTEWSALSILSAISKFGTIPDQEEAQICVQRLQPFLRHSNPAVALNAINVMIRYCRAGILQPQDIQKI